MARIRTLKPEFWQSEQLANCSAHARLLAIALLQLADSEGRMKWIPMQVHGHAFPYEEDLSINDLASELEAIGYLIRYEVDGKKYAAVPGFVEHQRLTGKEAAQKSKIPAPSDSCEGESIGKDQGKPECFPGKHLDAQEQGNRGTGEQGEESPQPAAARGPSGPPGCPHQEIIDLYHEVLPELPKVRVWTGKRERSLQTRWREDSKRQSLDWWRRFFQFIHEKQPFLMGKNDRGWRADLEWIVTEGNFAKIIEGARYGAREEA